MGSHDTGGLWRYAAAELDASDVAVLEHHLVSCPDCRDELDLVRSARLALKFAAHVAPRVSWEEVDGPLGAEAFRRLVRPSLKWLRPVLVAGFAAVAAALVVAVEAPRGREARLRPLVAVASLPVEMARVSSASGVLVHRAVLERPLAESESLERGDRLRTLARGGASVDLPDGSRLRLGPSSELTLDQVAKGEVALDLARGRLAVRAEHAPSRPFVVRAGRLTVHVVGTAFTVSSTPTEVEVAVGEGAVRVETELGESRRVSAGQRLRFDREGIRTRPGALLAWHEAELAKLGIRLAPRTEFPAPGRTSGRSAPATADSEAQVAPSGATPLSPNEVPQAPLSATESPQPPPSPSDAPQVPLSATESAQTPFSPSEAPNVSFSPSGVEGDPPLPPGDAQAPEPDAEDWQPYRPAPEVPGGAASVSPGPAAQGPARPAARPSLPRDLEGLFLRRAREGLVAGTCERFQLGLTELVETSEAREVREEARIARARCFDATLRPTDAEREYRQYLRDWPAGRWTDEARGATEER